ncbi:molybdenum cofactor guanylyltransferase [Neobacillus mesonae]|uniref:molybdenum cofactor guanylyltransferase n=1 Tax=Neobacillus mesonae TaxID=1193713 RepID=UPI00204054BA|nr:molybdenum cofactor guanylyltransferase [Neobacillus mesonae]MCM3567134.1 molybdenum cofactor guanylyltransferase [Neobacillus mesonae]
MEASAIILAGGKSSRMGTNKSLLKINGKTNIERIRDRLKSSFHDIILVTNNQKAFEFLEVKMVSDEFTGMGPLAGLHAGLKASQDELNFVAACDMPFVSAELAKKMINYGPSVDAVVPVINGKCHPLFAVYRKEIAEKAAKCMKNGHLSMRHLLDQITVKYITEKDIAGFDDSELEHIFFNMNEPKDYKKVKRLVEGSSKDGF